VAPEADAGGVELAAVVDAMRKMPMPAAISSANSSRRPRSARKHTRSDAHGAATLACALARQRPLVPTSG
jgi:hypothetical protein